MPLSLIQCLFQFHYFLLKNTITNMGGFRGFRRPLFQAPTKNEKKGSGERINNEEEKENRKRGKKNGKRRS